MIKLIDITLIMRKFTLSIRYCGIQFNIALPYIQYNLFYPHAQHHIFNKNALKHTL